MKLSAAATAQTWNMAEIQGEPSNLLLDILADWNASIQAVEGLADTLAGDEFFTEAEPSNNLDGGPA